MGRSPCCDKVGLKKGPWTPEEDQKLLAYIQEHGHGSWRALPPKAGLQRCGKSCRLRWTNYLRPDIKRGKFSLQEEQTIIQLHALLGNRWSAIASHLPKRTDNEIKNYWNTHLKKRLLKMGIDPTTHKPKNHALGSSQPRDVANLSHMAQWESARLEAEARIVRESKLVSASYNSHLITNPAAPPPPPAAARPPCLDILKVWQATWTRSPNPNYIAARKDAALAGRFFASAGTLESPTSILNFSDSSVAAVAVPIGMMNESAFALEGGNYLSAPGPCTLGKGSGAYQEEHGKGIMGNSLHLHDHYGVADSDPLRFPGFLEGFGEASGSGQESGAAFEDNNKINYWSNILNVVNSPLGSPVF